MLADTRRREPLYLLREMIEANIVKVWSEFRKAWKMGWDLSVDMKLLEESSLTMIFGQMNEPPGARATVALSGLTIAEYFH